MERAPYSLVTRTAAPSAPCFARTPAVQDLVVRDAALRDNASLLRLAARCPMRARVTLCVQRAPDFFALSRLQGDSWQLLVAEDRHAGIVGCIGIAERCVWLNGKPMRAMHVSDFKVDPEFRGRGVADRLTTAARVRCATVSPDIPVLLAALVGNRPMERRIPGPRDQPPLTPFGTVRVHTLFALGRSTTRRRAELAVRAAGPADLDAMAALWTRVAPGRQGAAVFDARGLADWIRAAPGLAATDYLVAVRGPELIGFVGLWDQRGLKATQVLGYGTAVAAARGCYNLLARWLHVPPLPSIGGTLHALHAIHVCVPASEPDALRALLAEGCRRCARLGMPCLEIGLDPRDPLAAALARVPGVRTDVRCFITTPRGRYAGPSLDTRPVHFETALV